MFWWKHAELLLKTYQEIKRRYISDLVQPAKGTWSGFVVVITFAVFVIAFMIWNSLAMGEASKDQAQSYVSELVQQVSSTIATDQADVKSNLSDIRDSVELLYNDGFEQTSRDDYITSYLRSIDKSSRFDSLTILRYEGGTLSVGNAPQDLNHPLDFDHPVVKNALEQNDCVLYVDNGYILYAVPIAKDGQTIGVLVGDSSADAMRTLVNIQIYGNEGSYCITNRNGTLLIESGNDHFQDMRTIFRNGSEESQDNAKQLLQDLQSGSSNVIEMTYDDAQYFLAYAPIEGENWMLLTLLPENVFSNVYTPFMSRALFCAISAALIFVILLIILVHMQRNARQKLEKLAFTDDVTEGINETEFQLRFERARNKYDLCEFCVVMLDVRNFRLVNELAGFTTGDQVLKFVYDCISAELDKMHGEYVARLEMDHFIVLMHEGERSRVQERLDAITKRCAQNAPVSIQGFAIEFRQGAAFVDKHTASLEVLEEHARLALRSQGEDARGCAFFDDKIAHDAFSQQNLDRMAEESIKNGDFVVYFQPKVSMTKGKVDGAEALVRWKHPKEGLISPAQFIPALEDSGRIQELDQYVFEEVCRWLAAREQAGKRMFTVSVNLSRRHFWKDDFLDEYVQIADLYKVDHAYIEFEITETYFADEARLAKIKEGIQHMHEHGFSCSVDDFGVGYSSLSLVHDMDVDTLKFDRSFFTDLSDPKAQKIARCLIAMAKELQLHMVVEGIETQDQIDFAKAEGCDIIQGFYYARPMPEEDFNAWADHFDATGEH